MRLAFTALALLLILPAVGTAQEAPGPKGNAKLAALERGLAQIDATCRGSRNVAARTNYPVALLAVRKAKLAGAAQSG